MDSTRGLLSGQKEHDDTATTPSECGEATRLHSRPDLFTKVSRCLIPLILVWNLLALVYGTALIVKNSSISGAGSISQASVVHPFLPARKSTSPAASTTNADMPLSSSGVSECDSSQRKALSSTSIRRKRYSLDDHVAQRRWLHNYRHSPKFWSSSGTTEQNRQGRHDVWNCLVSPASLSCQYQQFSIPRYQSAHH